MLTPENHAFALSLAVSLVWTFRALAACAGAFVLFDWIAHNPIRQPVEFPPYNRRMNSQAWACVAAGCLLAWASYVAVNLYLILPHDGLTPNALLAATWALIGGGIVQRAAARAEQPKLIWFSATLIAIGSFAVLALEGRPTL